MMTARHGMAVDAVEKSVYAIGGSTAVGDGQLTSSAEALKLPARKIQPASQWRSLPDAPTARLMTAWAVLRATRSGSSVGCGTAIAAADGREL